MWPRREANGWEEVLALPKFAPVRTAADDETSARIAFRAWQDRRRECRVRDRFPETVLR